MNLICTRISFFLALFFCALFGFSNSASSFNFTQGEPNKNVVVSGDIFGTRVFIENKGQFDTVLGGKEKILFALSNYEEKIFFTPKGIIYELVKTYPLNEKEQEELNEGKEIKLRDPKIYHVAVNWVGGNPSEVIPSEKQSHYFTYGGPQYNSSTYKKLVYKNVYPGIDVEYTLPSDKAHGIKYSFIVHPGANPNDIKILYTGDVDKIKQNKMGEIIIKTPLNDIIEHVPQSFEESKVELASAFQLKGDTIGFEFPSGYPHNSTFIIDPWVTTITTLLSSNYAYDVDYDFSGNTFIYGGNDLNTNGKYKVAKYNNTGSLLWTFSGIIIFPSWNSGTSWSCNFKVNKGNGKTYVSRNSTLPHVVRIDQNGNYDNWISNGTSVQEVWNMEFNCGGDVIVYGGANTSGEIVNAGTGAITSVTTFSPGITGCCQDVVSVAVDATGNTFVYFLGHVTLGNTMSLIAPSFTNSIWNAPSGFSGLAYLANKSLYVNASTGAAVAFNCLTVNQNYLFYYDGFSVAAYNKANGALVASTSASGLSARYQGGIAVDDCNNVYVGGNGDIRCFSFNGTAFSTLTPISLSLTSTYQYVYDLQINRITKTLYVCGSGFVGTYSAVPSLTCTPAQVQNPCSFGQGTITATSTSITCSSLGSATVTAIGGNGPFSYTWIPTYQTGTVATGLSPGIYTVLVYDAGTNITLTNTAIFSPLVPLTGSVAATGLNCFGDTNASASVVNLGGGSGNQTYLWSNGINTYTTPTISNLGAGNYTVTVTDGLTGCVFTQAFPIYQPPALNLLMLANTPTACAGGTIGLTAMNTGGSPAYTYTWSSGPSSDTHTVSETISGPHTYTVFSTDNVGCMNSAPVTVTFIPNPVLTIPNVSICPLETGTLNASGATTYTWNNGPVTGNSYSASPLSSTQYSLLGSALGCTSIATGSIVVKPLPVPTFTTNTPVCNGQVLTMSAGGGTAFLWTGPQSFFSAFQNTSVVSANPANSGIYNLTVTAANSCTASTTASLTVHPTPTLNATGSAVCTDQVLNLTGNSVSGAVFNWTGPNGFISAAQNPTLAFPQTIASGNYTLKVTSLLGCTNTAQANVTVTLKPVVLLSSNGPRCFGDQLNFNANQTLYGINYAWSGPNGFFSVLQNPTIPNVNLSANGVYTLNVSAGPCLTSNTTNVVIHALPTPTAINTGPVCEQVKFNLSVNYPSSNTLTAYVWQGPMLFTGYSNQVSRDSSKLSFSGIYTVLVTDIHGCQASSTTTVTIMQNPTVTAVGDTVCIYEAASLKGFGAASYKWYDKAFNFNNMQTAVIASAINTAVSVYTVIGTAANSCTASAVASVKTRPLPNPSYTVSPANEGCLNSTFEFDASGAVYYNWTGPNNFSNAGPAFSLVAISHGLAGTYSLTGTDIYGCRAGKTTNLVFNELPLGALIGGKLQDCAPFCSEYSFKTLSAAAPITNLTWRVNNRIVKGFDTLRYCFTSAGEYVIKGWMTDAKGCVNTTTLFVNARPTPTADFNYSPSKPIENQDEVLFYNQSKGEQINKWTWYFNAAELNKKEGYSFKENTSFWFKSAGTYPVVLVVKNYWGCADTVIKTLVVEEDFNVFVPTAFTPNGDGNNEKFIPVFRGVYDFHLSVFDRWGEKLFESTQFGDGWDGTYRGKDCQQDIYVWKMEVTSITGKSKAVTGQVTLYR